MYYTYGESITGINIAITNSNRIFTKTPIEPLHAIVTRDPNNVTQKVNLEYCGKYPII